MRRQDRPRPEDAEGGPELDSTEEETEQMRAVVGQLAT